jgi:hypothetical protein
MPEEDVKVARKEMNGCIASKWFMAQGTAQICQVVQATKMLYCRNAVQRSGCHFYIMHKKGKLNKK